MSEEEWSTVNMAAYKNSKTTKYSFLIFNFLFLIISVAPNDVIWKHEFNVRIAFRNRLESGSVPISKPSNGSGGVSISNSCTFPNAQHIPTISFLNLSVLQCTCWRCRSFTRRSAGVNYELTRF